MILSARSLGRFVIAFTIATSAVGCGGSSPSLESPVGELHRESTGGGTSEFDVFAEQFLDTDRSALADFRAELAPHGRWVDDPRLGTVWFPSADDVGENFTPYVTHGRWSYGQNEWVWLSDKPWGWITFHYGRWMMTSDRGWAWVPGRRYAGAWVVWRTGGGGYVGWGPAPANWYWQNGIAVRTMKPSITGFVYARASGLFSVDLTSHLVGMPDVMKVAAQTRPYRNHLASGSAASFGSSLSLSPEAPTPSELGFHAEEVFSTPPDDASLQRAWLYARPSGAEAAGIRSPIAQEPARLKEWVVGGPRYRRTGAR